MRTDWITILILLGLWTALRRIIVGRKNKRNERFTGKKDGRCTVYGKCTSSADKAQKEVSYARSVDCFRNTVNDK